MASTDRSIDAVAFVTDHFREILRRRLRELAGLALITVAFLGAIALATWSVQDPSLSHATHKPIENLLGYPGAIFSDLAMQLLGLAAVFLLVPEALLGWRLLMHRPPHKKWRDITWILAPFVAAAFASTWPIVGSWPLPTGLGGAIGDAVLRVSAKLISPQLSSGLTSIVLAIVYGLATFVTLTLATGWRWWRRAAMLEEKADGDDEYDKSADDQTEEGERERGSAWLGMIVHALLSCKARLSRWLRHTPAKHPRAATSGSMNPRQEPRFDNFSRTGDAGMAPHADDDAAEAG
jgi:S-DNA-T family DNA segregation ATPase FtsK/SpoIIIE